MSNNFLSNSFNINIQLRISQFHLQLKNFQFDSFKNKIYDEKILFHFFFYFFIRNYSISVILICILYYYLMSELVIG